MNHYPHHIGDYAEATAHLSFIEDAAYSRLIRKYYATEKPLPVDLKAVQRFIGARTSQEREAVKTVLEEFFTLEDDGWHQPRCDAELARYFEKSDKASASANSRWKASGRNANASGLDMRTHQRGNANASGTHDERNANQEPRTKNQEPRETKTTPERKKRALAPLPEGWTPKPETAQKLAIEFSMPAGGIDRYLGAFTDACRAKGYEYQDFDAAFANCVRQDWPKFRLNGAMKPRQKTAAELIDEAEAERAKSPQGQPETPFADQTH